MPIKVVVRADGSGTTYNFADYLGKVSPTMEGFPRGQDQHRNGPKDVLAFKGSDGVAKGVRDTAGAIGYVDFGYVAEYRPDHRCR